MSAIPENADWLERLVILARRLSTSKNAAGEIVCCLPKKLDPPKCPETVQLLEQFVFQRLIELQPEFSSGRGRKTGTKNKNLSDDPINRRTNKNTRNYRDRKRRTVIWRGEKILLEPGVNLGPPWKRLDI
jgi:hypothetical protein